MEKTNQIIELLQNSILDFKNTIVKLVKKTDLIEKLNYSFENLDQTKILLFIFLIHKDNMKNQILEFIKKFEIEETEENIKKIADWYNYFLEIKTIFI